MVTDVQGFLDITPVRAIVLATISGAKFIFGLGTCMYMYFTLRISNQPPNEYR